MGLHTLVVLLLTVAITAATRCPIGAIQGLKSDRCYVLSEETRSFRDADNDCQSQVGHLVSVSSAFENSFIRKFLAKNGADDDYWLGGHAAIPGQWQWTDGANFTYTNWDRGQPQAQSDQSLVIQTRTGRWLSALYIIPKRYVCEVPPLA